MSVISILIDSHAKVTDVVTAVRAVTGGSISAIQAAVADESPVYTRELFLNDFVEVADTLRSLIRSLESGGIAYEIREFEERIDRDVLMNILQESENYS